MVGRHWSKLRTSSHQSRPAPLEGALILFDVDGTLLDAGGLISDIMIQAFLAAGEPPPGREEVQMTIGLSLPEMVETLGGHLSEDRRAKILSGYRLRYFDCVEQEDEPPVFPGAGQALARLREEGYVLGITTGKARRSTYYMLESMNWIDYFHTVQCADDNPSKPNSGMIRRALMETGRRPEETVLVGDSRYDMRMAKAAGVSAVGVSWGYNPPVELLAEGAVTVAQSFEDLVQTVMAMSVQTELS